MIRRLAISLLLYSVAGVIRAAEPTTIPLWAEGAPGSETRRSEPEQAKDYWVRNVHNPSVTVFLPDAAKANGTAVVICPGGGHRELVYKAEGVELARFLNDLGVAAFVLKYRLGREAGTPYTVQQHARADGLRAMRVVRSRATEWGLNPARIGIAGFSAGGEVASMVAYDTATPDAAAADPIDRVNARPDFHVMIYPGPLGIPEAIPAGAPPAFFLAANDDNQPARTIAGLLPKYREARVPLEVHLFAQGGHAFNMGGRSKLAAVKGWPQRLADWLGDRELLRPAAPGAGGGK